MNDQAQTRFAPEEPATQKLLSFITAHFAVFSLLSLVAIVLCSTLFMYGYLSTFDLQLIWIIEYTDILKLGLVALALISSAIVLVIMALQSIYIVFLIAFRAYEGKDRTSSIGWAPFLLVMFGLLVLGAATMLPSEMFRPLFVSVALLLAICTFTLRIIENQPPIFYISLLLVTLTGSVPVFGRTLGVYTKYSKSDLAHDVFLRDRQMSNVRLVLFTSHHTVFYAGTDVVVLPTSEIVKIVAHPTDQQRWPDSELY